MKAAARILVGLMLATPMLCRADNRAAVSEPVAWGVLQGNTSCVIFAEGKKTSGRFYGVAITTKTVPKLTLVETRGYAFEKKEVLETQENLDELMQLAQRDRVKYVKIPEKYSPELLEKARAVCSPAAQ